ncbi:glutathione S-transferase family protein [Phenylobacterium sp.]|uniref:glutathione S-transferase family protein n=1 Tax=Phenylobacterium sp. TaxID=1871053 RepID=UPI00273010FF|nr:glutathione S-transferase family protein [Phenylobacterium sp.]MDP1874179.1 glutathione S-transferase family protein [Phenylobacterium sp.]MDP3299310.1 glutathione S-transferase family protein [Phenylobacterium sp.]MDP3490956.1 glutathione S-transferase family protein [Phenylobacterium sp.]
MLTVWGRADSSATARVMWALGETGLAHQRRDWGGAYGGGDDPDYRKISPHGRIPAVTDDDGFALWESNTIIRWLAAACPEAHLLPAEAGARWQAEAWMDWAAAPGRAVGAVRTAYRRQTPEPAEMRQTIAAATETLGVLDVQLRDQTFVIGDQLSIADLALGVIVHRWFRIPDTLERPALPDLAAWYGRLCARPAYVQHVVGAVSVRAQNVGMVA